MGHTHYWKNEQGFTDTEWDTVRAGVATIFENMPNGVWLGDWDGTDRPIVNGKQIVFNGRPPEDYETFVLTKAPAGFKFCKTAHRPYDVIVCAALLVATNACPGFRFSSDGQWDDEWQDARDLLDKCGLDYPAGFRDF